MLGGEGTSGGDDFNLSNGTTLEFSDNYTLNNGSQITGNGDLVLSGGTLDMQLAGGTSIADTIQLSLTGGWLQTDGDWTLPTVTNWESGNLVSSGILTNNGNLNITSGGVNYFKRLVVCQSNNDG